MQRKTIKEIHVKSNTERLEGCEGYHCSAQQLKTSGHSLHHSYISIFEV